MISDGIVADILSEYHRRRLSGLASTALDPSVSDQPQECK